MRSELQSQTLVLSIWHALKYIYVHLRGSKCNNNAYNSVTDSDFKFTVSSDWFSVGLHLSSLQRFIEYFRMINCLA